MGLKLPNITNMFRYLRWWDLCKQYVYKAYVRESPSPVWWKYLFSAVFLKSQITEPLHFFLFIGINYKPPVASRQQKQPKAKPWDCLEVRFPGQQEAGGKAVKARQKACTKKRWQNGGGCVVQPPTQCHVCPKKIAGLTKGIVKG